MVIYNCSSHRNNLKLTIWGIFAIFFLAAMIHSAYEITELDFLKPFAPVNESVWEHMKMMLTSGLIWMFYEIYLGLYRYKNYYFARTIGILLLVFLIPVLYYGYTAFTGESILVIDILITLIAAAISQWIFYSILNSKNNYSGYNRLSILILIILFILFVWFTYNPPNLKIFIPSE
ncbi:MAG: DUF6512 family protein [Clostridia bacterium]|nr:DUF6512 family protein [Clostridia bacterium]